MSRSGYVEDWDEYSFIYQGHVTRALRGRRGQKAILETIEALDAMDDKRLGKDTFGKPDCPACTLGLLAQARGVDVSAHEPFSDEHGVDEVDSFAVSKALDIAPSMVREVMYVNDTAWDNSELGQRQRWHYIRQWLFSKLTAPNKEKLRTRVQHDNGQ